MFLDINSNKLNVGDKVIFSESIDIMDESFEGEMYIIGSSSYLVQGEIISMSEEAIVVLFNDDCIIEIAETENNVYKCA